MREQLARKRTQIPHRKRAAQCYAVRTHYYDDEADDVSFDNAPFGPRSSAASFARAPGRNAIHAYRNYCFLSARQRFGFAGPCSVLAGVWGFVQ